MELFVQLTIGILIIFIVCIILHSMWTFQTINPILDLSENCISKDPDCGGNDLTDHKILDRKSSLTPPDACG